MGFSNKLLSNRRLRIVVGLAAFLTASLSLLVATASVPPGLILDLPSVGCYWLASAFCAPSPPVSIAAGEVKGMLWQQPRLVDMRNVVVSAATNAGDIVWPPPRRPPAIADGLWHDYLALYNFLGDDVRSRRSDQRMSEVEDGSVSECWQRTRYLAGTVHLATYDVRLNELDALEFFVEPGGRHVPPSLPPLPAPTATGTACPQTTANIALIIPFRNRWEHLAAWLLHMHPFLQRQQLSYTIYVVNQEPGSKFNRGMLLNIGFKEASLSSTPYDCYIFHDVDLLPENDNNVYDCADAPRHMSSAVDKFNYRLPYQWLIGGVVALTKAQFESVNGYSNLFFGWGGEDDDFSERLLTKGYQVTRYKPSVARYKMLRHDLDAGNEVNPQRYLLLQRSHDRLAFDGLNTLRYRATDRKMCRLFTWISVSIDQTEVYKLHAGVI